MAAMIRQLPKDLGQQAVPKITGQSLREAQDLVQVTVADDSGLLLGCCVWMPVFSTWRGAKGIYICDLYVMEHARGRSIGRRIMQAVARQGRKMGASYMRLEVDAENPRAAAFYARLGFARKPSEENHFLEEEHFNALTGEDA